uniref:Actin-associated protein FAM107A n=1 Tax=Sinocyclocheilus rhinocerous TaxID=307959 RepID=A0A673MZH7_9TELE
MPSSRFVSSLKAIWSITLLQTDSGYYEELIRPKKLHNPVKASKSHRELQRELIITHKRGAVVGEKPELQRVLQQRNRAQALKQDIKQDKEKSPLEQELLKRQMRVLQLPPWWGRL